MKTFKGVVAIIAVIVGIFFLLSTASDIQLGFGAVLIAVGLLGIPS